AARASQAQWEKAFPLNLAWRELTPSAVKTTSGSAVKVAPGGTVSIVAGAAHDTYTVEVPFSAPLKAPRLEAPPGAAPPGHGPGQAAGNFVISKARAVVTPPKGSPGGPGEVAFNAALADYAQAGFEPESVLNNKTPKQKGWAVGGQTGKPHSLTLIATAPVK